MESLAGFAEIRAVDLGFFTQCLEFRPVSFLSRFRHFRDCGIQIHDYSADSLFRISAAVGESTSEGSHLVILELRPIVEGMVVALGATDLATEKDLHRITEIIELHVSIPEVVADGWIL